jgi:hypothetical protein
LPAKIAENSLSQVAAAPKWVTDENVTPEKVAMLEIQDTASLRASMAIAESTKNLTKEAVVPTSADSVAKWVPADATAPPTLGGHQTGATDKSPLMEPTFTQPPQSNGVPTKSYGSPAPNVAAATQSGNVETNGLENTARELMLKYKRQGLSDKQAAMAAYNELLGLIQHQ